MDYYLCVRYGLFNGPVIGSDYTARHGGVVKEWLKKSDLGRIWKTGRVLFADSIQRYPLSD